MKENNYRQGWIRLISFSFNMWNIGKLVLNSLRQESINRIRPKNGEAGVKELQTSTLRPHKSHSSGTALSILLAAMPNRLRCSESQVEHWSWASHHILQADWATGWTVRGSNPVRDNNFISSPKCQDLFCGSCFLLFNGYQSSFLGG